MRVRNPLTDGPRRRSGPEPTPGVDSISYWRAPSPLATYGGTEEAERTDRIRWTKADPDALPIGSGRDWWERGHDHG